MSSVSRHDDFLSRLQEVGDRHEAAEEAQHRAQTEREARARRARPTDPHSALAEAIESVRDAAEQLREAAADTQKVTAEMMRTFKAFINDLDKRSR